MKRQIIAGSFALPLFLLIIFNLLPSEKESLEKINGISLVSPWSHEFDTSFRNVSKVSPNYVAIIPYAFTRPETAEVIFDHPRQWWGEKESGADSLIQIAKMKNLKIMLKPHLWVGGQGWAGDLAFDSLQWLKWEKDYEKYVLTYAKLAQDLNVDIFCIGTEIRNSVKSRPEFWLNLIKDVRKIYIGRVTYAANWDNYKNVSFWNELDYIGIDAYFPISEDSVPSVEHLVNEWKDVKGELRDFSNKNSSQILFTEYGYQSVIKTAGEHWKADKKQISMVSQANAYESLYQSFWKENWFAGGFIWKWHIINEVGGMNDPNFTPQDKPAEDVIYKWYSKINKN